MKNIDVRINELVSWVVAASQGLPLLVPVSGGTDSAVCAWLCTEANPNTTKIYHGSGPIRSEKWFESLGGLFSIQEDTKFIYDKEILRWALFLQYALANKQILVGSRTKTEDQLGTYSHASRIASLLPLLGVSKTEVMDMAKHIGVPKEVIQSSQTADPACGRPEELAIIPFELVDGFLAYTFENGKRPDQLTMDQESYLQSIVDKNQFKAKLPLHPLVN